MARLVGVTGAQDQVRALREAVDHSPPEREEAEELVADYERGRWLPVRLELFADLVGDEGRVERFDSIHVEGVWFAVPHDANNVRHAREAADQRFEALQEHLVQEGFEIAPGQLEALPFVLDLDDRLSEAIEGN